MEFHVAGELASILTPLVDRVLTTVYESRDLRFDPPFLFHKEEGVKVINGIVKTGCIPKGAKPNQNISAAQNFGFGLKIIQKSAEKALDVSDNLYVREMWDFLDDRLADEGQTMRIETLYKNFMGIGGPKDYGLTRRMVQIYLLCLVQQGKVRISAGPKSGLPSPWIDYSNLAEIDFSARVLDALVEVQKMARPENWEVLRPYAEKLLGESIPSTHDDAAIAAYRAKLRGLFVTKKEESARVFGKARDLFEALKAANPYETELQQIARLFATDIAGGDDISLLLYGLKEALGYQAFDTNAASQPEVDDLANRLKNYRDLERFLVYEAELRAAYAYVTESRKWQVEGTKGPLRLPLSACYALRRKLEQLQPYIDSEVRLKTELIGRTPPEAGETGTLGVLIHEYATVYAALHDSVMDRLEDCRREIQGILQGDALISLKILEKITALQPAVSDGLERQLSGLAERLFPCPAPSRISVEEQLKRGPTHECGLSFQNASEHLEAAESAAKEARTLLEEALDRKLEVFLNPAVRERLHQGESEPVIANLLNGKSLAELRAYLVGASLADASIVEIINRYLKRISVKRVKIADFKPSIGTVEKGQIAGLAQEFQGYLEGHLKEIAGDDDTLPMLQIE